MNILKIKHPILFRKSSKPIIQAISLGILAGMRTSAAPLILNQMLIRKPSGAVGKSAFRFIQAKNSSIALKVFSAGEVIADKLPNTPSRTNTGGLIARCISGTFAGAVIYKASGNNALQGAALGLVAAAASTFGFYLLRREIVAKTQIADPYIGATEDLLVIGAGVALVNC